MIKMSKEKSQIPRKVGDEEMTGKEIFLRKKCKNIFSKKLHYVNFNKMEKKKNIRIHIF